MSHLEPCRIKHTEEQTDLMVVKEESQELLEEKPGEKPFTCSQCGKGFRCKRNHVDHIRVHTGLKPFTCDQCGKSFAYKTCLNKHKDSYRRETILVSSMRKRLCALRSH